MRFLHNSWNMKQLYAHDARLSWASGVSRGLLVALLWRAERLSNSPTRRGGQMSTLLGRHTVRLLAAAALLIVLTLDFGVPATAAGPSGAAAGGGGGGVGSCCAGAWQ